MYKLILLFSLLFFSFYCEARDNSPAQGLLTYKQALQLIQSTISKDKIYAQFASDECLIYEGQAKDDYVSITVYEKHIPPCLGDPKTSPKIDTFRVNRRTKEIQVFNAMANDDSDEWMSYKDYLLSRKSR